MQELRGARERNGANYNRHGDENKYLTTETTISIRLNYNKCLSIVQLKINTAHHERGEIIKKNL